MRIILSGASGHMGRAVAEQAKAEGIEVLFGVDAAGGTAEFPIYASFAEAPAVQDAVVIDFSRPDALEGMLSYAESNRLPVVLATTGYTAEQEARVDEAAKVIPVFRSANMSVGVALLRHLCQEAARVLGESFDVEIVEAHHNRKVDAPSGTALAIADSINDVLTERKEYIYDRHAVRKKRSKNEIGIHAVRGGTIVGEHEVIFAGKDEVIELKHQAMSKEIFAVGAVAAAKYLIGKAPGMYSMRDLVAEM